MAKLYWRIKKGGKWTWKPAQVFGKCREGYIYILPLKVGEEEE